MTWATSAPVNSTSGAGPSALVKLIETEHVGLRLARLFGGEPDQMLDDASKLARRARDRRETGIGSQPSRTGMAQDIGDLFRLQHEIDRRQHRADPGKRKAHRSKGVRIARENREPLALANPTLREARGEPLDYSVEFRVRPARLPARDRQFRRQSGGGSAQQIRESLATNDGIHASVSPSFVRRSPDHLQCRQKSGPTKTYGPGDSGTFCPTNLWQARPPTTSRSAA